MKRSPRPPFSLSIIHHVISKVNFLVQSSRDYTSIYIYIYLCACQGFPCGVFSPSKTQSRFDEQTSFSFHTFFPPQLEESKNKMILKNRKQKQHTHPPRSSSVHPHRSSGAVAGTSSRPPCRCSGSGSLGLPHKGTETGFTQLKTEENG